MLRFLLMVIASGAAAADSKLPDTRAELVARLKDNVANHRGYDSVTEHASGPGGLERWVRQPAENERLCEALVASDAVEALPWVKRAHAYALQVVIAKRDPSSIRAYASCVYSLSLEPVAVWENGATRPFVAAPLEEELARIRLRPDRKPIGGLVAALAIVPHKADHPTWLFASRSVELSLTLTNVSTKPVAVELVASDIAFSFVASGVRHEVVANRLANASIEHHGPKLAPNQSVRIAWTLAKLGTSPFAPDLGTGGVMLKAIYRPTNLVSNTLSLYYFPNE